MTRMGSCHCDRSQFEVDGELPAELTRCTCTFCSKGDRWEAFVVRSLNAAT